MAMLVLTSPSSLVKLSLIVQCIGHSSLKATNVKIFGDIS